MELSLDEYETLRLIDFLGQTQEECARQMEVARTTVQSMYDSARKSWRTLWSTAGTCTSGAERSASALTGTTAPAERAAAVPV